MEKKPTNRQSLELIEYKLDSLMQTVSNGFARLDNQTTDMLKRIALLEIWQGKVDGDLRNLTTQVAQVANNEEKNQGFWNDNLIKIIIIIATALGTALTIILSQVKK